MPLGVDGTTQNAPGSTIFSNILSGVYLIGRAQHSVCSLHRTVVHLGPFQSTDNNNLLQFRAKSDTSLSCILKVGCRHNFTLSSNR